MSDSDLAAECALVGGGSAFALVIARSACLLVTGVAGGHRWTFVTTNLDALLTELYVIVDDHLIAPERRRPGRPKRLTDAELVCLAVAQVLLAHKANIIGCECVTAGFRTCSGSCPTSPATTNGSRPPPR
jgi:hypothetical protein